MSAPGPTSGRNNKIILCDFDDLKKKELERRKKLRLEQVRTQSKELSSKIRDRVAREKHRQLRNVEEIKRRELLSWKEKHVNNTMADYYYCLSNVGDAHVAAERENELKEQMDEQQRENRKIAVQRGRKALQKERLKNVKKNERFVKRKPIAVRLHVPAASPVNDELESDDNVVQESDSDVEFVDDNNRTVRGDSLQSPDKHLHEQKDNVCFTQVSELLAERRRVRELCEQVLESGSGLSKTETCSKTSEPYPKSPPTKSFSAPKSPQMKPSFAPKSPQMKASFAPKSPQMKPSFVPKSPVSKSSKLVTKSPPVRGVFVRKSQPFSSSAGTKAIHTKRNVVTKKTISPNKGVKSKNIVASPQRREFVPRFTKNPIANPGILKNKTAAETTTTESPDKVQFYDHLSKYGKEYDARPGMVVRETQPPTINANEAARIQNEMDEIRFKQLEELRRKSEQRSKDSLQKNQVRKDYENLTKELDELCKEENRLRAFAMPTEQFSEDRITQLARNRQQHMNRAFEDIYHKPVVLTCPPIGSGNENSSSSDVNVATSPCTDKQPPPQIDPFDSSDSCTSILLGYVDNRSRKLVKDIKQCKNGSDGDKRRKLVNLLTRLDHLRKLLMEEIVRNSSLNLEPFYRSVLEVETEQKEILYDGDANKENGEQSTKRKDVDSHEINLEKKIRELLRKEQNKIAKPGHDETLESEASGTITSNGDQSEPVKILIEVKNAEKNRKSHHPKKVTVTQIGGTEKQHKISVGSSASTVYRSPPATLHTEFTKVLSKQADVQAAKLSTKQATKSDPLQAQLGDYITRLLGMSQKSVDQLGVSTGSSITTPSESVIEVAENVSPTIIDRNHLNRVQMKINDSLRLAREVDESFKQTKNQAEVKKVQHKDVKLSNERQIQKKSQLIDAESKSPRQPNKMTKKTKQKTAETVSEPKIPENSKRIIADLTKRIEQVRQDKLKLKEITLSSSGNSSSGKDFDVTEYRDFVAPSEPKSMPQVDENICSSQASDAQSLPGHFIDEDTKNLVNTKQIGISFSRDSGIGSSRPVTSTDFRISPDIKLTEKSISIDAQKVAGTNLPILVSDYSARPEESGKSTEGVSNRRSGKPPISLKRYSPQLDAELQPHDLSTINEVETSVASRFNQSTRNETSESSVPAPYKKFPTFVEYAKMQEIASVEDSSSDADKSYSQTVLKKMLEVTCLSETGLHYRKLDESVPKNKTIEKSTNTERTVDYIDVEKEMKQRRLMETDDVSSSESKLLSSSSTSSDLLAKDFNRIGLNWASAMLKKTSTAQNLESSSSSIKSIFATKNPVVSGDSTPDDRINGNPLNIRDFLARELLKRSQLSSSSSLSDDSTLTDQFLKSLLTISTNSTNSSVQQQATLRTSTPNRNNQSTESEKFTPANDVGHTAKDEHLFSGESILSSVRGLSHSDETSGARETTE